MGLVKAVSGGAHRAERRWSGLEDAVSWPYPWGCSWAGSGEVGGEGPARLSVALKTTECEAALILSGKLVKDSLVAFEIVVEQFALTALPSVCVDVCDLTAVDWIGLCSLTAFGRWVQAQGMTIRVETGDLSSCSDLGLVLSVALGDLSPRVGR